MILTNRWTLRGFGRPTKPSIQLTAIIDNWNDYYIRRVQAVMDGTWESVDVWGGIAEDMVEMAAYTNMPDDVAAAAADTFTKIGSGELEPFTGPIMKQDGSAWLADGERADIGTMLGMNFYVKGVDDQLPQ